MMLGFETVQGYGDKAVDLMSAERPQENGLKAEDVKNGTDFDLSSEDQQGREQNSSASFEEASSDDDADYDNAYDADYDNAYDADYDNAYDADFDDAYDADFDDAYDADSDDAYEADHEETSEDDATSFSDISEASLSDPELQCSLCGCTHDGKPHCLPAYKSNKTEVSKQPIKHQPQREHADDNNKILRERPSLLYEATLAIGAGHKEKQIFYYR